MYTLIVKIPSCQQLAIGGFGIWWPDRSDRSTQEDEPAESPQNCAAVGEHQSTAELGTQF